MLIYKFMQNDHGLTDRNVRQISYTWYSLATAVYFLVLTLLAHPASSRLFTVDTLHKLLTCCSTWVAWSTTLIDTGPG